jgi:hypothetical protein
MDKKIILQKLSFGERIAEQEANALNKYFVETDQWTRILSGAVDVIYGPKGSGKSAIHALLLARENELFERGVLVVAAENPKGAPAFQDLKIDPPASEHEFVSLWKAYLLSLLGSTFRSFDLRSDAAKKVIAYLEEARLLPRESTLSGVLKSAYDHVRSLAKLESVEGGLKLDPHSGLPTGVTGKLTLREPGRDLRDKGFVSLDSLLALVDEALRAAKLKLWFLLDRLDVAFADSPQLEHNALRALFKVYLDCQRCEHLSLKIFLRSDIWRRITNSGFREASHIVKTVTISWSKDTLLNLIVRRALSNPVVQELYGVREKEVLADLLQQRNLFYQIFPPQVDIGEKRPNTFDWILSRTSDATTDVPAPRELIHLLNASRDAEIKRLEIGKIQSEEKSLISGAAIKDAMPEVSNIRYEQTLLAEHPELRKELEGLRGKKTDHTIETLGETWRTSPEEALAKANMLVEVGFFSREGTGPEARYWVPFLYRSALELIQGAAD